MKLFSMILCGLLGGFDVYASEGMFGYLYTAETTPANTWEYEQMQTWRHAKARGSYDSLDLRNEIEYGITDKLQTALYLNSSYLRGKRLYDPEDVSQDLSNRNEFAVNGVSVEFLYRLLSPYKDGFGLALYAEPEISLRDRITGEDSIERAVETRLILQKNFWGDTLLTVANLMLEPEWEKEDGMTVQELWAEWTLGASYRIKSNWFAGLEFRNHMEFPDMNLNKREHSAYFFGPTVHYANEHYWWTITVLPQVGGTPRHLGIGSDGHDISSSYAHLGQHEAMEVRFKFGIPLGSEHKH
ncbi:MAG: hypothetical protein K1X29_04645 [Bdellovibrionales bacterium]|nr:hypothetical protein [Bdellovibrionales bacterium]